MSPLCECYITSPFMEMNRLETGVTHAEEVGDKGLVGCSVIEMWCLNCTFSSSLLTFFFSPIPKHLKTKFKALELYSFINYANIFDHSSSAFIHFCFAVVYLVEYFLCTKMPLL